MSLDAVAKEAGVSKGGLPHHFRTKQALIVGLIEEWFDHYDATVESLLEPEHTSGRWTVRTSGRSSCRTTCGLTRLS